MTIRTTRGIKLLLGLEFGRYFLVSLLALAVDTTVLLLLATWVHYTLAASLSFLVGAGVHYQLSVMFVFQNRKLVSKKPIELMIFVAAGIGALLVNVSVIIVSVEYFAVPLLVAKLLAAGFSFVFGYGARKLTLF